MNRLQALHEVLSPLVGQPLVWGWTDCAALALRAADVLAARPISGRYLGRWQTEAEARAFLEHTTLTVVFAGAGFVRLDALEARAGDILIVAGGEWPESAHVCFGLRAISASISRGVHELPMRALRSACLPRMSAWRFG